jgi:hypothetical protein
MMETLVGQPPRISASLIKFSTAFDKVLGVPHRYSGPAMGAD